MNAKKYYVYLHIKETNGEPFYVGKGLYERIYCKGTRNKWWRNIVDKYGYDIIILFETDIESQALEQEIYWINRIGRRDLNTGSLINLTRGGEGVIGYLHTEDSRRKISQSQIGNKKNLGKKRSPEAIKNLSESHKGLKWSQESKDKASKTRRIVYSVDQYDLNDNFIKHWDNHWEAAKELNIQSRRIYDVCNGKFKSTANYKWVRV